MLRPIFRTVLALIALAGAGIACSAEDVIGRPPQNAPTPTVAVFATASPGGRISVMLITPTGAATTPVGTVTPGGPTLTPVSTLGQVIAPVGTATAARATAIAATQTAQYTPSGPLFQPADCPLPGAPLPPPKPSAFAQYPGVIGTYLSAGGPTTILEATLRTWGALTDDGGHIQADTDLTGKGFPDVIVTLYDPAYYQQGKPSPGQLLVYGCSQGGYRLLYSTPYTLYTMLPVLRRVGNMNGDTQAQLAFTQDTCDSGGCTQAMQILEWSAAIGAFQPLNDVPMNTTGGKIIIADVDGDGILEVAVSFNPTPDPVAGPPRRQTQIWDWDGTNYRLALIQAEPPLYRIQALYDADLRFTSLMTYGFQTGDYKALAKLYDRVCTDAMLYAWTLPNEQAILCAYANLKELYAEVSLKRLTDDTMNTLTTVNPPGSPGEVFATMATTFMDTYGKTRNKKKACDAAIAILATRADVLAGLNSYGTSGRLFVPQDFCPFTTK
ncbi:MAG TPA: hypothetical protein VMT34_11485 [Aggregatilineales bacterium]|nr:hypothetical protein [Aggregatilineales bacterium]